MFRCMLMLAAGLAAWPAAAQEAPAKRAYAPIDLSGVFNSDPLSGDILPDLEEAPGPRHVFLEGESFASGQASIRRSMEVANASGGAVAEGVAEPGTGAVEYSFNVPFDSQDAWLYWRAEQSALPAEFYAAQAALNGIRRGGLYAPARHPEHEADAFAGGVRGVALGPIRMGRQILRLYPRDAGRRFPVRVDCLWVGREPLDLIARLDANGQVHAPLRLNQLAYDAGEARVGGVPFQLSIEPDDGQGVLLLREEAVTIPLDGAGVEASTIHLLGAGITEDSSLTLTFESGGEPARSVNVPLPKLFHRNAPPEALGPRLSVGQYKYVWPIAIESGDSAIDGLVVAPGETPCMLLAVTLAGVPEEEDPA